MQQYAVQHLPEVRQDGGSSSLWKQGVIDQLMYINKQPFPLLTRGLLQGVSYSIYKSLYLYINSWKANIFRLGILQCCHYSLKAPLLVQGISGSSRFCK